MKKLVPILVFLLTACTAYSQPGLRTNKEDTCICVTPQEMRSAVRTDDTLQVAKSIIAQQDTVIKEMKQLVAKSDAVIKKQEEISHNDNKKIINLLHRTELLTGANGLLLDQNKLLKEDKNKLKKKLGWLAGVSTAIISGLVYIMAR